MVCGDFVRFVEERPALWFDVVFLDLPWGGVDYSKRSAGLELLLGTTPLAEVCVQLERKCRFVALKVPSNYDAPALVTQLGTRGWHTRLEHRFPISKRSDRFWLLLVLATPTPAPPAAATKTTNLTEEESRRASDLVEQFWS